MVELESPRTANNFSALKKDHLGSLYVKWKIEIPFQFSIQSSLPEPSSN